MTIHDRAHELTRAIKSSSEYLEYKRLKEEIESDAHLKEMIDDFHERQLTLQKQHLIDNQTDPVEEKKLHDLLATIARDPKAAEFLNAEMRFAQIMTDVTKILSEL
jgi:cell fate (sporulation/competence/biofilm development) regulator YlbF (YheA/YmcA/DUF963 family)